MDWPQRRSVVVRGLTMEGAGWCISIVIPRVIRTTPWGPVHIRTVCLSGTGHCHSLTNIHSQLLYSFTVQLSSVIGCHFVPLLAFVAAWWCSTCIAIVVGTPSRPHNESNMKTISCKISPRICLSNTSFIQQSLRMKKERKMS